MLEVAAQKETEHDLVVVVVDEQEVVDALVVGGEEVVDEDEEEPATKEVVPTARQVSQKMIMAPKKIFHCTQMWNKRWSWTLRLSLQGQCLIVSSRTRYQHGRSQSQPPLRYYPAPLALSVAELECQ